LYEQGPYHLEDRNFLGIPSQTRRYSERDLNQRRKLTLISTKASNADWVLPASADIYSARRSLLSMAPHDKLAALAGAFTAYFDTAIVKLNDSACQRKPNAQATVTGVLC